MTLDHCPFCGEPFTETQSPAVHLRYHCPSKEPINA